MFLFKGKSPLSFYCTLDCGSNSVINGTAYEGDPDIVIPPESVESLIINSLLPFANIFLTTQQ